MKKISIIILFFIAMYSMCGAIEYKKKFNPFTGEPDFVVNVDSTSVGDLVDVSTANASNGQALIFNSGTGVFEPGSAVAGVTSLPLPANATNYLLSQSTGITYNIPQSSFTIAQITATVMNVTSIRWPDGTIQVSSPTGGTGGSTDLTPLHTSTANLTNSINALNSSTSTLTTNISNLHTSTSNISLSITALNSSTATFTQGVNGFLLFRPTASAYIDEFNLFKTTSASRLDEWTAFKSTASAYIAEFNIFKTTSSSRLDEWTLFKSTAASKIEKSNLFETTGSVKISELSSSTNNLRASVDAINVATGTRFILNQNSLQSGATVFVSSGNINTFITSAIRWADGTVQVSSPIAGGGSTDLTFLHTSTANLTTRINNLDSSTATLNTRLNNLDTSTASFNTTINSPLVEIPVSPASLAPTITLGGVSVQTGETSSNGTNYDFVQMSSFTDQRYYFEYSLPKGYNGSTVTFRVVWTSTAGTSTNGVVFGLQALSLSDDDALDTVYGSSATASDTFNGTNLDVHITTMSTALTIGGTPQDNDHIVWRFMRLHSHAQDTLDSSVQILGIKLYYTRNQFTD